MTRFLLLLTLALSAVAATAQPTYNGPIYNGLDRPTYEDTRPGVRLGLGVGPSIYYGPYFTSTGGQFRDDAVATNLAVTGEITAPLAGPLYGRLLGGLLNIGAADDIVDAEFNPFLTQQTILAEANLLAYLTPARRVGFAPYIFSGIGGLFATRGVPNGTKRTALAIPVGLGFEFGVSRNLALFAEGSYRFVLTDISPESSRDVVTLGARANVRPPEYCDEFPDKPDCQVRPPCPEGQTGLFPNCREVSDSGDDDFRRRFGSGLIVGGLRLGFSPRPAPPARVPEYVPPPYVPPAYVPEPEPEPEPIPEPAPVCDLVELNSVYFDYGSSTVNLRARSLLDENVDLLLSNPACCVFIDGYTDTSEGGRFGLGVSGRRAQSVYDYYLGRGVSASKLQIRNRGEATPSCDKEDPGQGCERNRRVESLPVDCERFRSLLDSPSYNPY